MVDMIRLTVAAVGWHPAIALGVDKVRDVTSAPTSLCTRNLYHAWIVTELYGSSGRLEFWRRAC